MRITANMFSTVHRNDFGGLEEENQVLVDIVLREGGLDISKAVGWSLAF